MGYTDALEYSPLLLTDGATGTCLEYQSAVPLDPEIGPTRLVNDERGRAALEAFLACDEYRDRLATST